ncbi:MAG: ribonuclease HII [Magnetococcus sp. DMHC-6]
MPVFSDPIAIDANQGWNGRTPGLHMEQALTTAGYTAICGIDEAGRGPLAGPVVAAAVILPDFFSCEGLRGLNDSKKLALERRRFFYEAIRRLAVGVGVGLAEPEEIDRLNILQATLLAMSRAVVALRLEIGISPDFILVDGRNIPAELPCSAQWVIKGDTKSMSIAAAAVIAKVTRDDLMDDLAVHYPGYGWERNRGYPTQEHCQALGRLGVTPLHRRSYKPVQVYL